MNRENTETYIIERFEKARVDIEPTEYGWRFFLLDNEGSTYFEHKLPMAMKERHVFGKIVERMVAYVDNYDVEKACHDSIQSYVAKDNDYSDYTDFVEETIRDYEDENEALHSIDFKMLYLSEDSSMKYAVIASYEEGKDNLIYGVFNTRAEAELELNEVIKIWTNEGELNDIYEIGDDFISRITDSGEFAEWCSIIASDIL